MKKTRRGKFGLVNKDPVNAELWASPGPFPLIFLSNFGKI